MIGFRLLTLAFATAAGSAGLAQAHGQGPGPGADTPDLKVADKDLGDPRKFFLFHKPGIGIVQAEADLGFCWRFLVRGDPRILPSFVPWQEQAAPSRAPYAANPYGLVGDAIMALGAGAIDRSLRQSRMFRCMGLRGYARYRTSEVVWKQLNSGDSAAAIRIQARIAAGPTPPTERVLP